MRVFLRLWAAAIGDEEPSLREAFTQRGASFRDYFAQAIRDGQTDGSIREDVDARATAVALVALVRGIAMQFQVDPALAKNNRARAASVALIDSGL